MLRRTTDLLAVLLVKVTDICTRPKAGSSSSGAAPAADQDAAAAEAGRAAALLQDYVRIELAAALSPHAGSSDGSSSSGSSSSRLGALANLKGLQAIWKSGLLSDIDAFYERGALVVAVLTVEDPGSKAAMQLYDLLCTCLKLTAALQQQAQQERQQQLQQHLLQQLQIPQEQEPQVHELLDGLLGAVAHTACTVVALQVDWQGGWCLADTAAATAAAPSSRRTGQGMVPWLVLLGRCCLQWATVLEGLCTPYSSTPPPQQQQQQQQQQQCQAPAPEAAAEAERAAVTDLQAQKCFQYVYAQADRIRSMQSVFSLWLTDNKQQLPRTLNPEALIQSEAGLMNAFYTACGYSLFGAQGVKGEACVHARELLKHLRDVGVRLTSFPTSHACNNPACSSIHGFSEAQLVGGRSCICAGCRKARYCSRDCQRQHWEHHKPVCQGLAGAEALLPR